MLPRRLLSLVVLILASSSLAAEELPYPQMRVTERPRLSQLERLGGQAAPGILEVAVIGVDFSDSLLWGRDPVDFPGWPAQTRVGDRIVGTTIPIFAAHDSTFLDIQMQRVSDYFATVSRGQLEIRWQVAGQLVNLPNPMGFYADDDSSDARLAQMAQAAADAVDDEIDFSTVDTIVLIHAGAGRETDLLRDSPDQIFSAYLDPSDLALFADEGSIGSPTIATAEADIGHILVLPESESQDPRAGGSTGFFGHLGVYCFEFGLRLGMLNLSDFSPSGRPDSQGIGQFGLMGFGLFNGVGLVPAEPCAVNKVLMGWVDPVEVNVDADLTLSAIEEAATASGDSLVFRIPIDDRQYWLVEYRLQDPNGDLFFSFADSNANLLPDFYDADSEFGNGRPTGSFDPLTDTWESTRGAEWDFFMSDNSLRTADRCMRGGGSGLYIWHVDERIILDAFMRGSAAVNNDATRKGVDLEEADGLQDLDNRFGGAYALGWDGDAWRAEGNSIFGADTKPDSRTNDGLPTGVALSDIQSVVVDSLPMVEGSCVGFVYRPRLSFSFRRAALAGGAIERARTALEVAPTRFAPRIGAAAGGGLAIYVAAEEGAILGLDADLQPLDAPRPEPEFPTLLVRYEDAPGTPSTWLGPPVVGEIDGDADPELVVVSEAGASIVGLRTGNTPVRQEGLERRPFNPAMTGGAILRPDLDGRQMLFAPGRDREGGLGAILRYRQPASGGIDLLWRSGLPGQPAGALRGLPGSSAVVLPWRDALGAGLIELETDSLRSYAAWRIPEVGVGALSTVAYGNQIALVDSLGQLSQSETGGETRPSWDSIPPREARSWRAQEGPWSSPVAGPARPNGEMLVAFAAGGALHVLDGGLRPLNGFPYQPDFGGEVLLGDSVQAAPLLVDLDGDDQVEVLWHDPTGRIHAVDLNGNSLLGWPIAGPSEPLASPAIADLDGDNRLELVVGGRFISLAPASTPGGEPRRITRGELRVYQLEAPADAFAPWPQDGAGPDGAGVAATAGFPSLTGGLTGLSLQPNPLRGEALRVRVRSSRAGILVARLYNLEGELVYTGPAVETAAGGWYDELLLVSQLAGGLYLCRVEGGGASLSLPFAVAR